MEFLQHCGDFVRRMCGNIDAGGKRFSFSAEDHNRNIRLGFDFGERGCELLHHADVDHVDWRIGQNYASNRSVTFQLNPFEFGCGLRRHKSGQTRNVRPTRVQLVQNPSLSYSRIACNSAEDGSAVVCTASASFSFQPVFASTSFSSTPGWRESR